MTRGGLFLLLLAALPPCRLEAQSTSLQKRLDARLDRPPFNVPSSDLEVVLEVPGHGLDGLHDPGVIRTFRLNFPAAG